MRKSTFIAIMAFLLLTSVYLVLSMLLTVDNSLSIVQVCVRDGFSEEPIENARVVIPETGKEYLTNAQGLTGAISVPFLRDAHYDSLKQQHYGRITIIVYADGYVPYAVFFAHVYNDSSRLINTWLFEDDGVTDPFVIIESPDTEWANDLIQSYEK